MSKLEKGLDQDGRVGGCGTHLPPQTTQNSPTCGTSLMELETVRRIPIQLKLQERFPCNWVGWKKVIGLGPPPWVGL